MFDVNVLWVLDRRPNLVTPIFKLYKEASAYVAFIMKAYFVTQIQKIWFVLHLAIIMGPSFGTSLLARVGSSIADLIVCKPSCIFFFPFLGNIRTLSRYSILHPFSVFPSQYWITFQSFWQDIKHVFLIANCSFKEASYSGGGNITFKGSLEGQTYLEKRIFQGEFPVGQSPIHLIYSVSYLLDIKVEGRVKGYFC